MNKNLISNVIFALTIVSGAGILTAQSVDLCYHLKIPILECECGNITGQDPKLVGSWLEIDGGAAEWVEQNINDADTHFTVERSRNVIHLHPDGTFNTDTSHPALSLDQGLGNSGHGKGNAFSTFIMSGIWTADGTKFHLCPGLIEFLGVAEITTPQGGTKIYEMPKIPLTDMVHKYEFQGDVLRTQHDIIGAEPRVTYMVRQ